MRFKRDKDLEDMRNLSMHGVNIKNIDYYRRIIEKQKAKELDDTIDYDLIDKKMIEFGKEWEQ